MRSCALKNYIFAVKFVNQQPIRCEVAFPAVFVVAGEFMVFELGGEWVFVHDFCQYKL